MGLAPRKLMKFRPSPFLVRVLGLSILSALLKITLMALGVFPFNSDEAIVGLMARHTLGGNWPTFFYGQAYMGSLDATIVAAGFFLFGKKVIVIRAIQIVLYSFTVISAAMLGKMIFKSERVALIGAVILAIPTVNTTLYTTISLGGYGEALLIGNLILIVALCATSNHSVRMYALWGLLSGLGFWAFGITIVYILPSALLLIFDLGRERSKNFSAVAISSALFSGTLGAAPIIVWGINNGFGALSRELFGSAISGASASNIFLSVYDHLINLFLFGTTVVFGLRPPWGIRWLATPLIPLALAFWLMVIMFSVRNLSARDEAFEGRWLLIGVAITLMTGFIFSPFGADPSGRYFLPLVVPMALLAGMVLDGFSKQGVSNARIYVVISGILLFNLWGTIQSAARTPPGLTTQFDPVTWIDHSFDIELIEFLQENGETRGYSNYWVAYPIAFLSEEDVLFVPKLPYHEDFRYTSRDNRYQPYDLDVTRSDRAAFITTNHPELDQRLESNFKARGITWEETWIGDYHVFYQLSSLVTPQELKIESWGDEHHEDEIQ